MYVRVFIGVYACSEFICTVCACGVVGVYVWIEFICISECL